MNADSKTVTPPTNAQMTFAWIGEQPEHNAAIGGSVPLEASTDPHNSISGQSDRYDSGHPWHYLPQGDNAIPLSVDAIAPSRYGGNDFDRELPKSGPRRPLKARQLLESERGELQEDVRRYNEIVERGADALSRYDREIAHGGDLELARATALALKHNQIAWRKGRIEFLERQLSPKSERSR